MRRIRSTSAGRARSLRALAAAVALVLVAGACSGIETFSTEEAFGKLDVASTKVYAADGTLLANLHGEMNRDVASLEEIPEVVRDAVVAIEDSRFRQHRGVDLKAIARAFVSNLTNDDEVQGGSTLSQQLVKNLYFPNPDRTMARKLAEARITFDLERNYSKEEILEMYLNTVYFGRGTYGVEAAARSYFRKDVEELELPEAAFLAGLIHEPGRYAWSEDDPPEHRERRRKAADRRRDIVLERMRELDMIDDAALRGAAEARLGVEPALEPHWEHPYFVDLVLRRLGVLGSSGPDDLDERFAFLGDTPKERSQNVHRGGLRIHTSLDPARQRAAEDALAEAVPEDLDRLSGALVSLEPDTGLIRAVVGGRDYYPRGCDPEALPEELSRDCRIGKLNLALGEAGGGSGRQPGSAFKPFTLAAALEGGISLRETFSSDVFTHQLPSGEWKVRNYSGSSRGRMTVLDATVHSVNAAYARLMIHGVGDGEALEGSARVADLTRRMGFSFPSEETLRARCGDRYGFTGACTAAEGIPAISLGAKEVSPLEMASAYATFANDGVRVEPTAITRITDRSGRTLYEADPDRQRAVSRDVARGVTYVLQQVVNRGTGTGADLPRPDAGKTGTSQLWRDAWFAGFVPQLATVVWIGNPIPVAGENGGSGVESMTPSNGYPRRIVGGSYPAQAWRAYMLRALDGVPERDFPSPPRSVFSGDRDGRDDGRRVAAEEPEEPEETPEAEAASTEDPGRRELRTPRAPRKPSHAG